MIDGATLAVTPIHRPDVTEVSTETLAVLVTGTTVELAAVATAPPDIQRPVPNALELAPACPMARNISQYSNRNGASVIDGT